MFEISAVLRPSSSLQSFLQNNQNPFFWSSFASCSWQIFATVNDHSGYWKPPATINLQCSREAGWSVSSPWHNKKHFFTAGINSNWLLFWLCHTHSMIICRGKGRQVSQYTLIPRLWQDIFYFYKTFYGSFCHQKKFLQSHIKSQPLCLLHVKNQELKPLNKTVQIKEIYN